MSKENKKINTEYLPVFVFGTVAALSLASCATSLGVLVLLIFVGVAIYFLWWLTYKYE